MKKSILLCIILSAAKVSAQDAIEQEIRSTIKKVIVYTQGAQIENHASFTSQPGRMTLKLTGLSPYINKESIRIMGDGSFTILNVQHQIDFINELERTEETDKIKKRIEQLQYSIEDEETAIKIINDKLDFLNANKEVTGTQQPLNPETFKALNAYYGQNVEALNLEVLKKQRLISNYQKELGKLNNELNPVSSKSDLPSGTILISLDSKATRNSVLDFAYLVDHASWYPTYDIRFTGINKPLSITYKANIKQNTGVDWKNVNLVLSAAKTDLSAQIPEFSPFYLNFYYPEISQALQGRVAGLMITEASPGAESAVRIRGISSYSGNQKPLYIVDGVPQSDISTLNPDDIDKMEVLKDESTTSMYGAKAANGVVLITKKQGNGNSSVPLTIISKRETSDEYEVDLPQTILSNDKTAYLSYRQSELPASYEYQSLPALSENIYLIGNIADWYKADLMNGEANLYLENSFVGTTNINTQQFKDTLEFSFGVDNHISIKREKAGEFAQNQFLGQNRKETTGYRITVPNNKAYPVTAKITDQVPVSQMKDIEVDILELSGGVLKTETGKVEWNVKLNANESKELILKYSVKYPKDKKVIIE